MKKEAYLVIVFCLGISFLKAQECSIVGTWTVDQTSISITETTRDDDKNIIVDTLSMGDLKEFRSSVPVLDSLVFLDGKIFKVYSSGTDGPQIEEGTYSISNKKFKWKKKGATSKSKTTIFLRKLKNADCSLPTMGIDFFNSISGIEKGTDQSGRGAITLHYKAFPKN